MNYVTSDIHGYPLEKFMGLLGKAGFTSGDWLYVLGDVIDRNGDGGVAMLRWMMAQPNVTLILGNHEKMLLDCDFLFTRQMDLSDTSDLYPEEEKCLQRWYRNGASVTVLNLLMTRYEDPRILTDILSYLRSAPLYMELAVPGKRFVLVHGGLQGFSPERPLDDYSADELVWTRPAPDERYWDDRLVVLGHTPVRYYGGGDRMLRTDTWLDIDTGAAGGGSPMILRLEDLREYYAD